MKRTVFVMVVTIGIACIGQEQQSSIADFNVLVGKQVIVQRIPLCQPGTYNAVLTYAGKQATVVSLKPFKLPYPISQTHVRQSVQASFLIPSNWLLAKPCPPPSPSQLPQVQRQFQTLLQLLQSRRGHRRQECFRTKK